MKAFTCFLIDDDADDQEIFISALGKISPAIRNISAYNGQDALDKLSGSLAQKNLLPNP